jgi:hypothetical protein
MAHLKLSRMLAALFFLEVAPLPALADEMDERLLVQEGQPLREAWEECAASYAKTRLTTEQSAETIAAEAFRRCKSREERLQKFLAQRIGTQKAQGVIALLQERYRSDLAAAVDELRPN